MKNVLLAWLAIIVLGLGCSGCKQRAALEPTGFWKGSVDINGNTLLIYLRITKEPDGKLAGAALNIASGNRELPMTTIFYNKPSLLLQMKGRLFRGNLISGGKQMSGRWEQNTKSMPIVFERIDKLPELASAGPPQSANAKRLAGPANTRPGPDLPGLWRGTLELTENSLRLVLKVKKDADDTLTATVDSLDQDAKDIPVTTILFNKPSVRLELDSISAKFDGQMNANASEIPGNWSQGGRSTPLTFKRDNPRGGTPRPAKPPLAFERTPEKPVDQLQKQEKNQP